MTTFLPTEIDICFTVSLRYFKNHCGLKVVIAPMVKYNSYCREREIVALTAERWMAWRVFFTGLKYQSNPDQKRQSSFVKYLMYSL
jgi:hypothetical protein